jgi:putative acetyltransferase
MYVHKDYQGQGVASNLLQILQDEAIRLGVKRIWANVSITAKPFFERYGFVTVQPQTVQVRGVSMNNFRMEKALLCSLGLISYSHSYSCIRRISDRKNTL